ncbi:hypothetical protein NUW58_g1165 [Xylaria curta]|uniref:Uncharacterized protein n=1 Tax=Xylaria curta TaxID=42375 RepID=A0ACC1PLK9_9PEZI|nr:hypothetical protein NUW58_g1165 [Xylaria curta]
MAYAAGLQQLKHSRGPCFQYPLECPAAKADGSDEAKPNEVNIWLQIPVHFLFAVAEVVGLVALNEYIYSEAPTDMKAMVQALQLASVAVGSALGIALGVVSKNPWLVILFSSLSATMTLTAVVFWALFRQTDGKSDACSIKTTENIRVVDATVEDDKLTRTT